MFSALVTFKASKKMERRAAISLGAVVLISLPVIFYYIDGSCVGQQMLNISDSLVKLVSPIGDWSVTFWCFIVEYTFVPCFWMIYTLQYLVEFIQMFTIYAAQQFLALTKALILTPIKSITSTITNASYFISNILSRVVQGDKVTGEIMVLSREGTQCLVDDQQCDLDQKVEFVTALSNPDSFRRGLQCSAVMYSLLEEILKYFHLVFKIISLPFVMVTSVAAALYYAVVHVIVLIHYMIFDAEGFDFGHIVTSISRLFFFIIETFLKYTLGFLETTKYFLEYPLCEFVHILCVCGLYGLYPVFYLLISVWCLVKLAFLVIVGLIYVLTVCLKIVFVVFGNLINLFFFLFSVVIVLLVSAILLTSCILVLISICYIWVYVLNRFLLREKFRILSPLQLLNVREKTNNLGSDQVRHKSGCTVAEDG